jgi:hypothetical protein
MGTKTSKAASAETPEAGGRELTSEQIAARAYEIHLSGTGGDDFENWLRAETELRAEQGREDPSERETAA